ncbi:alpha/beta hydrolase [Acidiphilium sp. C61]|jgi:acetyl esterase/lipase|uniref:alpha/beta hydrolase n=1 Tax=Acidiphilium sp. C61 TaxID=1671485 RepID=UPI00157AB82F|nr:alpha/beta hydrolase [Acidiphilium sp. C61]
MTMPPLRGLCAEWGRMSRIERDRAYDNSSAVPESPALNEARIAASREYRARHAEALDLRYGPRERNLWDIYPAGTADAPCLVFIHGGYWQRNRREDFACLAEGVRAHGWSCALPGYTLAPEATLAEIVAEINQALDWLAVHGAAHGVSGKVVLSGWSAGGHLAAMGLNHRRVTAGLAISGVFELGPLRDTYLDEKLHLTDEQVAALSPLRLPAVAKPLAIAYGSRELAALVSDSRDLHALRAASHAPGPLVPVAGADHFTILDALRRPDGELTRTALGLLS